MDASLDTFLPVLSVTIFEKIPLDQIFSQTEAKNPKSPDPYQLILFK